MAYIAFKDNLFCGVGTFAEKEIWKAAGFDFDKSRRCWTTPDLKRAMRVTGVSWTKSASDYAQQYLEVEEASYEMSWQADSTFEPPCPTGINPGTGKPFAYLGYQKAGIEFALLRKDTLIGDQPGLGKGQPLGSPVLTPSGWRPIGDLSVGDQILHPRLGVQTVTAIYDRGLLPTYRTTFSDGASTLCSDDHLWTIRRPRYVSRVSKLEVHPVWETLELRDIEQRFSGYKTLQSAKLRIPLTKPIEFEERDHVIAPYSMGAILGDGGVTGNTPTFSSEDTDIVRFIRQELPDGLTIQSTLSGCDYRISGKRPHPNPWTVELRRLGLMGKGGDDKLIPKEYLIDSRGNRESLLQGLLDTDGTVAKDGTVQFSSNSFALVEGVMFLAQSLGGVTRLTSRISASGKRHWLTTLNLHPSVMPFRCLRKAIRYRPKTKYTPTRIMAKIERVEDQVIRCIKVSSSDGLYITDECIVTHNTIQAIGVHNASPEARSALVVCPASLKENWRREWVKWTVKTGLTVGIAECSYKERVPDGFYKNGKPKFKTITIPEYWPDTDVVIINYDILDRFTNHIKGRLWDLLVCDECHALKTESTRRTLFVLGGVDGVGKNKVFWHAVEARRRLFLSGTPMLNRPIEMWPFVKAMDPDGLGSDKRNYEYDYCAGHTTHYGYDNRGASNLEELGEKVRKKFMVRRLKREVLPELPPKRRMIVALDSPEIRELVAREDEVAQALRLYENHVATEGMTQEEIESFQGQMMVERASGLGIDEAFRSEDGVPKAHKLNMEYGQAVLGLDPPMIAILFEELARIRHDLGVAKLSAAIPWCRDFMDGGEKLLMFAYHSDVVEGLRDGLAKYNPAVIYGKTAVRKRQGEVDRFQEDEECEGAIGNIDCMGVGYTMTRGDTGVFVEGDWVPTKMEQCLDRMCRLGQSSDHVDGYFLVANGSIDARIAQSAKVKEDNIELAMDSRVQKPTVH